MNDYHVDSSEERCLIKRRVVYCWIRIVLFVCSTLGDEGVFLCPIIREKRGK